MLELFYDINKTEAGVDEAGRGCYAGPVFAAAVILPKDFYHPLLNDSKKLSEKQRDILRPIIEKESIAYGVASVDNNEIDVINILQASFKAMHLSIQKLKPRPELLLIDGNRFKPYKKTAHHAQTHMFCFRGCKSKYQSFVGSNTPIMTRRFSKEEKAKWKPYTRDVIS